MEKRPKSIGRRERMSGINSVRGGAVNPKPYFILAKSFQLCDGAAGGLLPSSLPSSSIHDELGAGGTPIPLHGNNEIGPKRRITITNGCERDLARSLALLEIACNGRKEEGGRRGCSGVSEEEARLTLREA